MFLRIRTRSYKVAPKMAPLSSFANAIRKSQVRQLHLFLMSVANTCSNPVESWKGGATYALKLLTEKQNCLHCSCMLPLHQVICRCIEHSVLYREYTIRVFCPLVVMVVNSLSWDLGFTVVDVIVNSQSARSARSPSDLLNSHQYITHSSILISSYEDLYDVNVGITNKYTQWFSNL